MFQLVAKIINFLLCHKFSFEIGFIGVAGILMASLEAIDHAVKILIGATTMFFIFRKEYKERKASKKDKINF